MITIIIPAHNEKDNLRRLLPSLKESRSIGALEVLVALSNENCDRSEEVCCNDNIRFVKSSKKGRAVQMNTAAAVAKGDTLVFLHADVRPPDSFLDDIKNTLAEGYDAGFFSYRFDKKSLLLKINAWFTAKEGIFTGGGDQCLFIKKELFFELGRFDEKQVLMEDFEFFERMKKNNVRYKIIKNDLIVSARKYRNNSYLRVNLSNLLLVILFKFGYPPEKLKSLHNRLLRLPYRHNSQSS